jgi:hypothetical protein
MKVPGKAFIGGGLQERVGYKMKHHEHVVQVPHGVDWFAFLAIGLGALFVLALVWAMASA